MGDVIGDLNARRGRSSEWSRAASVQVIARRGSARDRCSATRPTCARATQGRATYTMQFSITTQPVPRERSPRRS